MGSFLLFVGGLGTVVVSCSALKTGSKIDGISGGNPIPNKWVGSGKSLEIWLVQLNTSDDGTAAVEKRPARTDDG